ncbi:MAG: hypothetical protein WC464_05445 [Bdellovibrionales bacterium]
MALLDFLTPPSPIVFSIKSNSEMSQLGTTMAQTFFIPALRQTEAIDVWSWGAAKNLTDPFFFSIKKTCLDNSLEKMPRFVNQWFETLRRHPRPGSFMPCEFIDVSDLVYSSVAILFSRPKWGDIYTGGDSNRCYFHRAIQEITSSVEKNLHGNKGGVVINTVFPQLKAARDDSLRNVLYERDEQIVRIVLLDPQTSDLFRGMKDVLTKQFSVPCLPAARKKSAAAISSELPQNIIGSA